jgi:hypothetical protein
MWEPTIMHFQANFWLLVGRKSEASTRQSVWTTAAPMPAGSGTARTADKDADHIMLVGQLALLLLCDRHMEHTQQLQPS